MPSALLSERDLEKRGQKIDAENVRHAKRLGEIMGDDAADLDMCPMCSDDIAGFIYAPGKAPLSDEAIARVRMAIGMPVYDTLVQPPWAQACGDCQGQGKVKTGSVVPGKETTDCPTCGANGWINTRRRPEQNGSLTDPEGELITTGPTVFGLEPDERIASLREDGYTVIPPPTWTTA